jgi:hypothetical protein
VPTTPCRYQVPPINCDLCDRESPAYGSPAAEPPPVDSDWLVTTSGGERLKLRATVRIWWNRRPHLSLGARVAIGRLLCLWGIFLVVSVVGWWFGHWEWPGPDSTAAYGAWPKLALWQWMADLAMMTAVAALALLAVGLAAAGFGAQQGWEDLLRREGE